MENDLNKYLNKYLNDHLAGSVGGLLLAQRLADTSNDPSERLFFHDLKVRIAEDRDTLIEVIRAAGFRVCKLPQSFGSAIARAGIWRMGRDGFGIGDLGRFELIELLTIGIHGKSILWRTLYEISGLHHTWIGFDFGELERSAVCQDVSIECYRRREALLLFGSLEDREVIR